MSSVKWKDQPKSETNSEQSKRQKTVYPVLPWVINAANLIFIFSLEETVWLMCFLTTHLNKNINFFFCIRAF